MGGANHSPLSASEGQSPESGEVSVANEVGYRLIVNPDEAFLSRCRNQLAVAGEEVTEIHAARTG